MQYVAQVHWKYAHTYKYIAVQLSGFLHVHIAHHLISAIWINCLYIKSNNRPHAHHARAKRICECIIYCDAYFAGAIAFIAILCLHLWLILRSQIWLPIDRKVTKNCIESRFGWPIKNAFQICSYLECLAVDLRKMEFRFPDDRLKYKYIEVFKYYLLREEKMISIKCLVYQ